MTSPTPTQQVVTPLQFAYLAMLSETTMTSRQMRAELAQSGVEERETAFFRVIQRLKRDGLITVKRIPREADEYQGSQAQYELTEAGRRRVAVMQGLYRRAERRVRRLRWGRRRRSFSVSWRGRASRHLPTRTVVRGTTDGSQVTELLTNVRSGRRRLALLSIANSCKNTTYDAGAARGTDEDCQNGIDSKARPVDLSPYLADSRLPVVALLRRGAGSIPGFSKIAAPSRRVPPATPQFVAPNCQVAPWNFEIPGFKSTSRSRKSAGRGGRSAVCNHPQAHRLQSPLRTTREPRPRLVQNNGCDLSQPCPSVRQTIAGPNLPTCWNSKGENHGKIPNQRS
jgi:DNA-binding PadR family transcriptional regulator